MSFWASNYWQSRVAAEGNLMDDLVIRASALLERDGMVSGMTVGPVALQLAGGKALHSRQTFDVVGEHVHMGEVEAGGFFMARNHGEHPIHLRPDEEEEALAAVAPGDVCLFRLAPGVSLFALVVPADEEDLEAEADLEYFVVSP